MPVLKRYTDGSGYYVHASIDGVNQPITLQCGDIAAELYRELGYDPDRNGNGQVAVPNELTWTLYEVGLHWTNGSGSPEIGDGLSDKATNGPQLKEDDIDKLSALIRGREGATSQKLNELLSLLSGEDADPSLDPYHQYLNRTDDEKLGLWEIPDAIRNHIAKQLENDVANSLNGQLTEWTVDITIAEWKPGEDPGKVSIMVGVEHLAASEEEYFDVIYLCEDHGLEQTLTVAREQTWRSRIRIENQRAQLIECIVDAAEAFDFSTGSPFDGMHVVLEHDPSIFEQSEASG